MDIVAAGIVNPSRSENYEICSAENYRRGTYRRFVFRDEIPVGFLMVNDIEQAGVFLSLIQKKISVNHDKERLMDPSFNFKQLLPSM
jgi:NAD(P)H-nitrite reductase large subunit